MILYLSSVTSYKLFNNLVNEKKILTGHQAQKFNSLVVKGLCEFDDVTCISNLPFEREAEYNTYFKLQEGKACFYILPNKKNKLLRKLSNLLYFRKLIKKVIKENKIEAIICDAINPLASLMAIYFARRLKVPTIALVTDIPEYMDEGRETVFTKLTSKLLKKYNGYVLLTEAMNELVNSKNRPYIIMEGLCEPTVEEKKLPTNKDKKILLYSGSLSKGVGVEMLLQAFKKLNLEGWELHIYGNGELKSVVSDCQKSFPAIQYKGVVPNDQVVQRQKEADVLINPRPTKIRYGNVSFPSKIMEYMVSGTAVLTTRLPGIPKEYFNYVYLIENDSIEGMKKAIKNVTLLSDEERNDKGNSARQYVISEKSCLIQCARIVQLLAEIKGIKNV